MALLMYTARRVSQDNRCLQRKCAGGGKSGLHRAECQLTAGGREPTTSAAERRPPT